MGTMYFNYTHLIFNVDLDSSKLSLRYFPWINTSFRSAWLQQERRDSISEGHISYKEPLFFDIYISISYNRVEQHTHK